MVLKVAPAGEWTVATIESSSISASISEVSISRFSSSPPCDAAPLLQSP